LVTLNYVECNQLKNLVIILLFIAVVIVSALFFAQNDALVEIKYFGGSIQWQMNWILVSVFILGALVGVSSLFTSLITTKVKLANANRNLLLKEKEVSNLRALPIKNDY